MLSLAGGRCPNDRTRALSETGPLTRLESDRGCEVYVVREGWEGLVRGNTVPEQQHLVDGAPAAMPPRRRGGFVPTYGEGELLKEGEGEQTLKDRYIIRVRPDRSHA